MKKLLYILLLFSSIELIAQTPTSITLLENSGKVGESIRIYGHFFEAAPGNHTVTFNGTTAQILNLSGKFMDVEVPAIPPGPAEVRITTSSFASAANINFLVERDISKQIQLVEKNPFVTGADFINDSRVGDIDDDGFLDIIAAIKTGATARLSWFKNDGAGNFTEQTPLSANNYDQVMVADFNNDGRIDVVASGFGPTGIYINNGGGNFTRSDPGFGVFGGFDPFDMDYDGDIDVLAGYSRGAFIHPNNGNGTFGNSYHVFDPDDDSQTLSYGTDVSDINNDNYADVLVGSERRGWSRAYLNDPTNPGTFIERLNINQGNLGTGDIAGGDVDGDGDNDVISRSLNVQSFLLNLNNGDNTFSGYEFITEPQNRQDRLRISDLNNDGQPDLITNTQFNLYWYQNSNGSFEEKQNFTYLSSDYLIYPGIETHDLDQDGDLDIVMGSIILENQQDGIEFLDFAVPNQLGLTEIDSANRIIYVSIDPSVDITSIVPTFTLSALANADIGGISQTSGISQVDFNNPVIYTVTSEFGTTVDWEVNVTRRISLFSVEPPTGIPGTIVKIFGTGFDVNRSNNSVTFGGTPAVVQNDASPTSEYLTVVVPDMDPGPTSVSVTNPNGQTFSSINFTLINTTQDDGIAWNPIYEWQTSQVTLSSIKSEDMDGDGYLDILTTSSGEGALMIRYNDPMGGFEEPVLIHTGLEGLKEAQMADFDRDGIKDILLNSTQNLGWIKNNGDRTYEPFVEIANEELWITNPIDFDLDGDIDIIYSDNDLVSWVENDGNGGFTIQTGDQFQPGAGFVNSSVGDLNNDGKLDLIIRTLFGTGLDIYENTGGSLVFNSTVLSDTKKAGVYDISGDGVMDLIGTSPGPTYWFENLGSFSFGLESRMTERFAKDYRIGDVNGDGYPDIFLTYDNYSWLVKSNAGVYEYNPSDKMIEVFPLGDNRVHMMDIENDGDLDLLTADAILDKIYVLENQNTQKELIGFSIPEQLEAAAIDQVNKIISIKVATDTDLTTIIPTFSVSSKARLVIDGIDQFPGSSIVDFTDTVSYNIISENLDTAYWQATVLPIPDVSETQGLLFIGQTQAIYYWSPGTFADTYEIQVSTDASYTNLVTGFDPAVTQSSETNITLAGLSPGTFYFIRIRSVNEAGESAYSDSSILLTLPATPQVVIDSVMQTRVKLSWADQPNVTEYKLDVSTDGFQTFVINYFERSIPAGTNEFEVIDLEPGETYYLRLKAVNPFGESPPSQFVFLRTIPATPVPEAAQNITPVSFDVGWESVDKGVTGYVLQVFNSNLELVFENIYTSSRQVTIDNLISGQGYFYLIYSYNEFGFSPPSPPIQVVTLTPDPIEITVTADDLFPISAQSLPVQVDVSGGWGTKVVVARYKGITSKSFQSENILTEQTPGNYQVNIQPSFLDEMGLIFEIATLDELGNGKVSDQYMIRWSFDDELNFSIPFTKFGGGKNDWQMFSVPFEMDDDLIESVFDEIGNSTYKKEWRLVTYRNSDGEYVDFGGGINRISPGQGFWFNSIERVDIKLDGGQITDKIPFPLDLEAGWNQIGNPFNVPISWTNILTDNGAVSGTVGNLQVFDGQNQVSATILNPFEAAFVWSDQSGQLNLNPSIARSGGRTEPLMAGKIDNHNIDESNWELLLNLDTDKGPLKLGGVGMHLEAQELKDPFDEMMLPPFVFYTSLATYHPKYNYPWFSKDIQPTSDRYEWDFTLRSNQFEGLQSLKWDNSAMESSQAGLYLIDLKTGKLINMKATNSVEINGSVTTHFRIIFDRNSDIMWESQDFLLGTPYPNPTAGSVRIPLLTPIDIEKVEVSVYDLQGRKIRTLLKDALGTGYHEIIWNLDSDFENKVNIGTYIIEFRDRYKGISIHKKLIVK